MQRVSGNNSRWAHSSIERNPFHTVESLWAAAWLCWLTGETLLLSKHTQLPLGCYSAQNTASPHNTISWKVFQFRKQPTGWMLWATVFTTANLWWDIHIVQAYLHNVMKYSEIYNLCMWEGNNILNVQLITCKCKSQCGFKHAQKH